MTAGKGIRGLFGLGDRGVPAPSARRVIGLALGGGAVRGAAHLGVLSVFERAGIEFDVVAGTSIGAVVGVGVAARVPSGRLVERLHGVKWLDLARPSWGSSMSLLDVNPMVDMLLETIGRQTFEDLDLPLAVVATDMHTASPVVFTSGPLHEAVLASAAVPGLFLPVRRNGQLLVDGGVVENLPVDEARSLGADIVVAVDIMPRPDPSYEPKNLADVLLMSLAIAEWHRTRSGVQAEVLITPDVARFQPMDLSQVQAIYEAGVAAAEAALDDVLAVVGGPITAPEDRP